MKKHRAENSACKKTGGVTEVPIIQPPPTIAFSHRQRVKFGMDSVLRVAIATLLGGVMIGEPALADNKAQQYKIPAQSLNNALMKFAADSKLELIFSADMVRNLNAKSLDGAMTPEQALRQLLQGSGYTYRFIDGHTVTLEKAPEQLNKVDPTTLKPVNVTAKANRDVTDPYNQDYVLPNATAGTKTDTPIMDTPLNIQVVSKQVMKDQQVITLADSLKNVSGVTTGQSVNKFGWGSQEQAITLRGFASETYFRNGFRILEGSASRSMANVESVEVLKGPAAILYGMVDPGGMVNVITKQPLATPYYSMQQQSGSYNMYRTTIDATGPIANNKDVLYRMNMSYENSGSFREFVNNEKFYIAPVLKWNISPRTQATLEFEYNHDNNGMDTGFVPLLNGKFLNVPYGRNYGEPSLGKVDTFFGAANWSHQFSDDWSVKHSFSVKQGATDRLFVGAFTPAFSPTGDKIDRSLFQMNSQDNTYATNLDLVGKFNTYGLKHTMLLGGDYYRTNNTFVQLNDNFSFDGYIDPFNPVHPGLTCGSTCWSGTPIYTQLAPGTPNGGMVLDPNTYFRTVQHTDQYGLYLQDQIKLPYNFHFTGGLRYQYIHRENQWLSLGPAAPTPPTLAADAVTPRVGLLWQPQNWLSLYSNYAENFGPNTGLLMYPNKPIPPTSAQQWELGAKTEFFGGRLRATAAYYDLTKNNVPSSDPAHPNSYYSVVTGAVRSRGPELDIQGEILPGWNLIGTYANTDIFVTKAGSNDYPAVGSRYFNVPRNTASLWNTYDFQQQELRGFKIGGGVTVRDGVLANTGSTNYYPGFTVAGYATMDLLASYSLRLGKSKVSTQLNVNNLLDKHYYTGAYLGQFDSANGLGGSWVSFGAPRTLMGSIKVEF